MCLTSLRSYIPQFKGENRNFDVSDVWNSASKMHWNKQTSTDQQDQQDQCLSLTKGMKL